VEKKMCSVGFCMIYYDAANPQVTENKICESTDGLKADSAAV
jgi:hypothetical protein